MINDTKLFEELEEEIIKEQESELLESEIDELEREGLMYGELEGLAMSNELNKSMSSYELTTALLSTSYSQEVFDALFEDTDIINDLVPAGDVVIKVSQALGTIKAHKAFEEIGLLNKEV